MPTGLIPDQHDFLVWKGSRHLCQVEVHHLRIDPGQEKGKRRLRLMEKPGINIEILVTRVYWSGNSNPFPRPTTSDGGMQSETTFVKKEHHAVGRREKVAYFLISFFLKDSWACLSALACRGRGTFCLKPNCCTKSQVAVCPKEMPNCVSMASISFCNVQKMGSPWTLRPSSSQMATCCRGSAPNLGGLCPLGSSARPAMPLEANRLIHRHNVVRSVPKTELTRLIG